MAVPLASPADIEASGHTVTMEALPHFEHLLRLGSALLRLRFKTIDARLADAAYAQLVVDVLVAMVLRAPSVSAPEGIKSESVGSYSVTYQSVQGPAGVELWLLADEVALLAPADVPAAAPFGSARLVPVLAPWPTIVRSWP